MNQATIDILMRFKDQAARPIQRTLRRINRSIQQTTRLVFSLKGAFAALGVALTAKSFLDTATQFERFELQLRTIEGSADAARRSLDWITEFTANTPYELAQITAAFVKLRAYGIDPTDGTLRTLGDTAAAMGKTLDQAVEALADASQGEFERLKEFGIRARSTADEVTFAWTDALGRMREVTVAKRSDVIRETLAMIWNDRYAGGMAELSRSWSGMWSNLMDRLTLFKNRVMEAGPFLALKAGLAELLSAIDRFARDGTLDRWAVRVAAAVVDAFEVMIRAADAFGRSVNVLQGSFGVLLREYYQTQAAGTQETLNFVNDRLRSLESPGITDPMQLLATKLGLNDDEIARLREQKAKLEREVADYVAKAGQWDEWIRQKADQYVDRSGWLSAALAKLDELRAKASAGLPTPAAAGAGAAGGPGGAGGRETLASNLGPTTADLRRLDEMLRSRPATPDEHWLWVDPAEGAREYAEVMEEQSRKIAALMDNATTNPLRRLKEVSEEDKRIISEVGEWVKKWAEWKAQAEKDWTDAAVKGLTSYRDNALDTYDEVRSAVEGAFLGMEDALVRFVETGKLSFKSFADSVISDLARIAIRAQITGPLAQMFGGFFGAPAPATPAAPTSTPFPSSGPSIGGSGWWNAPRAAPRTAAPGPVRVTVVNQVPGVDVQASERPGASGREVEVLITRTVAGDIDRGGDVAQTIQRVFGLARRGY